MPFTVQGRRRGLEEVYSLYETNISTKIIKVTEFIHIQKRIFTTCLEYLILISQSLHYVVKLFCITTAKLHNWLLSLATNLLSHYKITQINIWRSFIDSFGRKCFFRHIRDLLVIKLWCLPLYTFTVFLPLSFQ